MTYGEMRRAMLDIRRHDPDGGTRQPTPEDYAAFHAWIRAEYGEEAMRVYFGSWDSTSDV